MTIESFRILHEVVRLGSMRRAAEHLGVVPSSIGRQISLLERQMGTALFERSTSGVKLTYAGELVAQFGQQTLLDYDALKVDLDDYRGGRRALIRIASVEGMVAAGPVTAISRFQERYNLVQFSLRMVPAPRVVELVKLGEVDVGLTFSQPVDEKIRMVTRVTEPLLLVTRRPGTQQARLGELAEQPIALPSADFGIRRIIDLACEAAGIRLNPVFTSDSFEALRAFALTSDGATILPQGAMRGKDNVGLRQAVLVDRRLQHTTIDLITPKQRRASRVVRQFLDELSSAIAQGSGQPL